MNTTDELSRSEALEELEKYDISGPYVYLIDIIPLIEMIWADGKVQEGEVDILYKYLKTHIKRVNAIAGFKALTMEDAMKFANRFIETRPDPTLLKTLRNLYTRINNTTQNEAIRNLFKSSLLAACMDIASSSVTDYPYDHGDRFNPEEKKCFFEIFDSLENKEK